MATPSTEEVKTIVLSVITRSAPLRPDLSSVPDSFNLFAEGAVDSFGFLELLLELERRFGIEIDLSGLRPEQFGEIGALSRYVAERAQQR
jgi:acyl carrier protein